MKRVQSLLIAVATLAKPQKEDQWWSRKSPGLLKTCSAHLGAASSMALRKDQLLQSVRSAISSCFPEIGYRFALAPWAETSQEKQVKAHSVVDGFPVLLLNTIQSMKLHCTLLNYLMLFRFITRMALEITTEIVVNMIAIFPSATDRVVLCYLVCMEMRWLAVQFTHADPHLKCHPWKTEATPESTKLGIV